MDHVFSKIRTRANEKFFKIISDRTLYEPLNIDLNSCIEYNPDHCLDEDAWFKITNFKEKNYCIDLLKSDFYTINYEQLNRENYSNIDYIFSFQDENFYFQNITPSFFIRKKMLSFGDVATLEESGTRLVVNQRPDAVYYKNSDTLIFKKLIAISKIFKGIDELYKEATNDEVQSFLNSPFIELAGEYGLGKVSKPNRKRIGLTKDIVENLSSSEKSAMVSYIEDYCTQTLDFDRDNQKFKISNDDELKTLLYGIDQRFYTTPVGNERRFANSVACL